LEGFSHLALTTGFPGPVDLCAMAAKNISYHSDELQPLASENATHGFA
jgi:hypothetical protein